MHETLHVFIIIRKYYIFFLQCFLRSLLTVEKERDYYRLIGVFWLRAGDDRLDVIPLRGFDPQFRGLLRRRTWLNSLDDNRGTVFTRTPSCCHVDCCTGELDGKLSRWHRVSLFEGKSNFVVL